MNISCIFKLPNQYYHQYHLHNHIIMNPKVVAIILVVLGTTLATHHHEEGAPAPYHFEYGVHDPHTGDVKAQYEHSDGKHVVGTYTLKEADGTKRIVKYHAGPHGGFNAVVERVGHAQHPAVYGHKKLGGHGGTSYVGVTHFGYQH